MSKLWTLAILAAGPVAAQTTDCHRWSPNDVRCQTNPTSQISPYHAADGIKPGNPASAFINAQRAAEEANRREEEAESQRALEESQRQLIDEQTRALRLENERRARAMPPLRPEDAAEAKEASIQRWLAAATPRVALFPDFQSTVFAEDLALTPPMIEWMSHSKYAADVAYYLGKHKDVAAMIARQDLQGMANSLSAIESDIVATAPR